MLKFEWDENKNIKNKEKHKISFQTAEYVFLDPRARKKFDRISNKEERYHIIGKILDTIVVTVVYTTRNQNIRIISARKANKKEKLFYENQ